MRIAQAKDYGGAAVRFEFADAYALGEPLGRFDGALAIFWWSHIPLSQIDAFLSSLHARLESGARVVLMDNAYVEGSSTPVAERDAEGNTYQLRGTSRVLKNFPAENELRERLQPHARAFAYRALEYYWLVEYELK